MKHIRRVLVPTAFSELSRRAAEYVPQVLHGPDAEVHVLHVIPPGAFAGDAAAASVAGAGIPAAGAAGAGVGDAMEAGKRGTESFAQEQFAQLDARLTTATALGDPAAEIVRYAAEHSIDLILMGTHADGILKRLIFGSVSKAVLEHAPCPVLLVPCHGVPRL